MDFSAIWQNPDVALIVGGALGGITRALALRVNAYDAAVSVVLGSILGYEVAPQFVPTLVDWTGMFKVDHAKLPGFTAYLVGVGAIVIVGFMVDWWNARLNQLRKEKDVGPPDNGGS